MAEIAAYYGISEEAAKKRAQRALKKLKTIFEEDRPHPRIRNVPQVEASI